MDPNSGRIYSAEELDRRGVTAEDRARLVPIDAGYVTAVKWLTRPMRREWAKLVQSGADPDVALAAVQSYDAATRCAILAKARKARAERRR